MCSKQCDEEANGTGDPNGHDHNSRVVSRGNRSGHVAQREGEDPEHDEVTRPAPSEARAACQGQVSHQKHGIGEEVYPAIHQDKTAHSIAVVRKKKKKLERS